MLHLLHGLPGAGKSEVLQLLHSFWETVWKYELGAHFVFVAYPNAMADNIGGFTMHNYFRIDWKKEDGTMVLCLARFSINAAINIDKNGMEDKS
eukprot:4585767-Karenia_brevis.AAC.1